MVLRKKVIGRNKTEHGKYVPGQAYGKKFIVTLFDCGWESKHENNTSAPATLNAQAGTITENTTDWKKKWGSYKQWLIDNGYQKMDASSVKDGNNNQHQINASFANEIGSDSTPESIKGRVTILEEAVGTGGSVDERIATEGAKHYLKSETYTKEETNNLITTPNQEYVSVTANAQTTAVTDVLPATGASDTTYRVGNWDGTQYSESEFSEYAWNGSAYIKLSTKSQVGEVYDISANHADAKYADLAAALNGGANIPQSLQKGGMSIKFVQSSDNKYVQYLYHGTSTSVADFTNVANWEKVNLADELSKIDTNFTELTALYDDEKQRPAALDTEGKKITSVPYSYMTPRFIGVNPNQEFAYKLRMASGNLIIAFYSSNNEDSFISGIPSDNTIQEGTINAPSTAKYIRFCTYDFGDTSIGYYVKTGMLLLENEISALKEDTAIINITKHYPPASGYYQLTDNTATNYAPSAITDSKYQTPGRILLFRSGLTEWLAYKFVGGNNTVWSNPERWVKIADANDIEELQSQIRSTGVTNVTTLIPLESGYYQCSDANEANYAPQALLNYNANYRKRGAMIKIEVSEYKWETYIFEGANSNDSWLSPTRWKRLLSTDDLNDIHVGEGTEVLSLNSSEQLLIIGQSHAMGHGSIKNKSFASYLSALTDWNVLNMGEDGSNYIKHLSYILNNTTLGTGAKFGDCDGGGVCLDFLGGNGENTYFNNGMDGKYTENNIKRLYSTLKSKGFDVICCNAFGDQPNSIDCIQAVVAKELGLQLVDINSECARITQKLFTPYWYSGHFGTRTNAIQVNSLLNTIKLRRPRTAIKLFRNRISATNDELLYDNVFEKVKLWEEISINHRALSTANNKYVDRLDKLIADGLTDESVTSEYTKLKNGSALSFTDKGLVEFILPCTCDGLNNLMFKIVTSGTVSLYVRKFIDSSLAIATTPASANFKISGDVSYISVGDVFTDTLNSGVSFTVTKVDAESNTIICNASGTFVTPGQTTDTLTRTSDSVTFAATSLIEGVPEGYISASENSFGKWESVTPDSDGFITLSNLGAYMDYDKVTFLIDGDSSFTISDIYATYDKPSVSKDYNTEGIISIINDKGLSYTTVLTDVFVEGNMEGIVSDDEGSYFWNGKETVDGVERPHIPDFYAGKGATSILHLKAGDKVSYTISDLARPNPETNAVTHLRVKIVARYFPASNLDINAGSFTVTPETFDFGKLGFKYSIGVSNAVYTDEFFVPASFVEIYKDIYLSGKSGNSFEIIAIDNDVELLYLEVIK